MNRSLLLVLLALPGFFSVGFSQIYQEAEVPVYTLPEALVFDNGKAVLKPKQWDKRRTEILAHFGQEVYGEFPTQSLDRIETTVLESSESALDGLARRRQIRMTFFQGQQSLAMDILLYTPKQAEEGVPVFLGMNFYGNQTIHPDPAIEITKSWVGNRKEMEISTNQATEASRGKRAHRWPVEEILLRGYGLATVYYGDIDPDFDDDFQNGIHALMYRSKQTKPDSSEWGSLAAWAWGLSRALDYLETDEWVEADKVMVLGHSRLGKAALWAGATDERFAAVISNDSGCGGAALSRREFGETVRRINTVFPHWFNDRFPLYNEKLAKLPVDQHLLLSLVAPRPLYVASASEDLWADPKGEFLATQLAGEVYEWMGYEGLSVDEMPDEGKAALGRVSYHLRSGKHDLTLFDWGQYLDFADEYVNKYRAIDQD